MSDPGRPGIPDETSTHPILGAGAVYVSGTVEGNIQVDVNLKPHDITSQGLTAAYLEQVRRVAPPELIGRDEEMAELTSFCLEPHTTSAYQWWRAPAWAGKSALLATFVLNPPPGVRVISFFITARLASQDTRDAFITWILGQLTDITGDQLPPSLDASMREAILLKLLAEAADACRQVNERLILVVDGLDEERSTTTGPAAHSIAGILPPAPAFGMRVIVAGRHNPPIPDDVPDWHPLRGSSIVRELKPSLYAKDLRRLGQQELKRLIRGAPYERDILGLLTAARGGLSGHDLEDLTKTPLWDIEELLHTTPGRTFTRRATQWGPEGSPEVYLLGHEELQNSSRRYLGAQRLSQYRARLDAWIDGYRDRRWPIDTPEYPLRDYARLLQDEYRTKRNDLGRLTGLVTDPIRRDRMLDLAGGDAPALDEVRATLELIAEDSKPDLTAALRLSYHRDYLTDRNRFIPPQLPAVWVRLGRSTRAEALAQSISIPSKQAEALLRVAAALSAVHDPDRAETVARAIPNRLQRAEALAHVAVAFSAKNQIDYARQLNAEALALSVPLKASDYAESDSALCRIAVAWVSTGDLEQAEAVAQKTSDSNRRAVAIAVLASALHDSGHNDHGFKLVNLAMRSPAMVEAQSARPRSYDLAQAVAHLAASLATLGDAKRAVSLARSLRSGTQRAAAFAMLSKALMSAGEADEAAIALAEATDLFWSDKRKFDGRPEVLQIVRALVLAGRLGEALAIVDDIENLDLRVRGLAVIADSMAVAGDRAPIAARASDAEAIARSIAAPDRQARAASHVAEALAAIGKTERAEQLARSIKFSALRSETLARVAAAEHVIVTDDLLRYVRYLDRPYDEVNVLVRAAINAMRKRDSKGVTKFLEEADRIFQSMEDSPRRSRAASILASTLARTKDPAHRMRAYDLTLQLLFAGGGWQLALAPILELEPNSVGSIISMADS